jgi:hypothetical protein
MHRTAIVGLVALAGMYSCIQNAADADRADSTAADAPARGDTTPDEWTITDPERQFLRIMADHHAGMAALARTAQERTADSSVRANAQRLAARYAAEGAQVLLLLRRLHRDAHRAMTTPVAEAMNDSLRQTPPAAVGRGFAEAAAAHYRDDLVIIDRYLPSLQHPEVKALAQRLRDEEARELAEVEEITTPPAGRP